MNHQQRAKDERTNRPGAIPQPKRRRSPRGRGRGLAMACTVALVVAAPSAIDASQSYQPPASGEAWVVTKVYCVGGGRGVVAFLCNEPEGIHRIQIYAEGLQPDQVYALWLRDIDKGGRILRQKRVTRKLFPVKTDATGVYRQVVRTLKCPVDDYNGLMLSLGANDFTNGVLFGRIPVEQHTGRDEADRAPLGAPGAVD